MRYKHFYFALSIRLAIIILLSGFGVYLYVNHHFVASIILMLAILIASYSLIRYFNKINRWISFFLLGIENDDTSLKIPGNTGNKTIDQVFQGMQNLNNLFKQTKTELATKEQYYKTIINKSATGLFSINENGRIENINPAAMKLLEVQEHHHINSLKSIDSDLPAFIHNTHFNKPEQSAIFENKYGQKLLFNLSHLQNKNEKIKLIAVSDITKELDNREIEAWVKLARTLSHEIMNNITPITTLSQVISSYFVKNGQRIEHLDTKTIDNTIKGLDVIEGRSVALMNFVNNYRKFTKLPAPEINEINISKVIENCLIVIHTYPGIDKIAIKKMIPADVFFQSDEKLLSQVIINLLKNAFESLIANPKIKNPTLKIHLTKTGSTVKINISNNGSAIPKEIKEQIFVPFFTTKENGSGVGLSLSKQILLKMGGDVILKTSDEVITEFEVVLR